MTNSKYFTQIVLTTILIIFSIFHCLNVFSQVVNNYNGHVRLDSLKILNATFKIDYVNNSNSDVCFYLNKDADIKKLTYKKRVIDFEVVEIEDGLKKICVKNIFPEKFMLDISYSYNLEEIDSHLFPYNSEWLELNLYTAWFPVNFDNYNYSFQVSFELPNTVELIGNGSVKRDKRTIVLTNDDNHFDIPVVITKGFQRFNSINDEIEFYSLKLSENKIAEINQTSDNMYSFFQDNFGKVDSNKLRVIVNPFKRDISYARKGFISFSLLDDFGMLDKKILAHEIAHLWWLNAKAGTWEDWLNESFAEFSSLKWIEKSYSNDYFQKELKKYEKAYSSPIKMSETKTGDDNWYSIAYLKGSYILYKLEKKIGEEKMFDFLKSVNKAKVSSTIDLIEMLKNYADDQTIKDFENDLYVLATD